VADALERLWITDKGEKIIALMRLYFIAGEASGDLHGAHLIKALCTLQPGIICRAWGGDRMAEAGATVVKHYRELAFMGFVEVVKNLPAIWRNFRFAKQDIVSFRPDALVLIDYPGFNMRMARWARKRGFRVIYYISPQLWAWHASRAHAIRRYVDKMLVVFPFEVDFYRRYGVEATWVGHPLFDALPRSAPAREGDMIALLPGSRQQEVRRLLPTMLSIVPFFKGYRFVIAAAHALPETLFRPYLADYPQVELCYGDTYGLLQRSRAAVVKSGTSTLEAALLGAPQVVCYAGHALSYAIARRLVRVPYISLVNLVLERPLVRELIQDNFTPSLLREALEEALEPARVTVIQEGYEELRRRLGGPGASLRAADSILKLLAASEKGLATGIYPP
jgi:lipid-A-disaccharide synthase